MQTRRASQLLLLAALSLGACTRTPWHASIQPDPQAPLRAEIMSDDSVFRFEPPFTREQAFILLLNATAFQPVEFGLDNDRISKCNVAVKTLYAEPDACDIFLDLIHRARNEGKLYALCGLYNADRRAFANAVIPFLNDHSTAAINPGGCVTFLIPFSEILSSPDGQSDILHGAYPRSIRFFANKYLDRHLHSTFQ